MSSTDNLENVRGLLFIGDPHLEARIPGFRKDDYPQAALRKFRWCLKYARQHQLQPILLGDLFHLPQDNPNWLLSAVIESIDEPLPAIYGNHDVRENTLKPNDSIHILFAGGHLKRISDDSPWVGMIGGRRTVVGGTVWGEKLPKEYIADSAEQPLTVWITHHDIFIPGYEEAGRIRPSDLPGIDLIVNGHVHRRLAPVSKGGTHWVTAGNITRRARSDASRLHIPAVPCLVPMGDSFTDEPLDTFDFQSRGGDRWQMRWIAVPHESFDDVFHSEVESDDTTEESGSGFIADLRQLTARRTDSGAGLSDYLSHHLDQFEEPVAAEILRLAEEVTASGAGQHDSDQ
jgi:DNA repair exonuclease SbcCD nuclease subunit